MKTLRKNLKLASVGLLICFFTSLAQTNAASLGAYRATAVSSSNPDSVPNLTALPAVALAAYGAVLVGAFVIGAVNGYFERQTAVEGGGNRLNELTDFQYDSQDFTDFDV